MSVVLGLIRAAVRDADCRSLFAHLGYEIAPLPLTQDALVAWGYRGELEGALELLVALPGFRVVTGFGVRREQRRAIALAVRRRNPVDSVLWVWVDEATLTFAQADARADGTPFFRKLVIDRAEPDAVGLEQVAALALDRVAPQPRDAGAVLRAHVAEVLSHEGLTRAFFGEFRAALHRLLDELEEGPKDDRERHEVCLVTLLRVVFLYFVQKRGLLDGDRRFIARHLRSAIAGEGRFHGDVLRPLFFGVLNTPQRDRTRDAQALGDIPFLNGGLFEPLEVERRHERLRWSNDTWTAIIDGFLERYHFTASEPDEGDELRVVDPEMLGRVFEGLMYGDDRHKTGAFYTPRDVVQQMVDATITKRLADLSGIRDLGARRTSLTASETSRLRVALESITVLDPAVGTGAFLLEALVVLRRWWRETGADIGWDETRRILHANLFGVDVERTAIRLCELRLWLAMLSSAADGAVTMEPLPNLSHRVVTGNSLVEPGDFARLTEGGRSFVAADVDERRRELEARLRDVEDAFLTAHGERKLALRAELRESRRALQVAVLSGRLETLERRLAPLEAVNDSSDLFGEPMATREQVASAEAVRRDIERVRDDLSAVRLGRGAVAFGYESAFGAAASRGFDVVLTNPPWVRAQRIDPHAKAVLTARYRSASPSLWRGARELGIRAPFGTQVDASALFLERSLELLAPDGRLCALVPAKLLRGLHGCALREVLARHTVEAIEDLSEADRSLFDATTYPAIISIRKSPPRLHDEVDVALWRGAERVTFRQSAASLSITPSAPAAPWVLAEPPARAALDEIVQNSVPLGAMEGSAPRRGIFTGANDLFVAPRGEWAARLGEEAAPFVRPLVTGASLGEGDPREILWCYDERGVVCEHLPSAVADWFESHRERLVGRADYDPNLPLWQVFRVTRGAVAPYRVVWRDIGERLEAHVVPPEAVLLNTVYFIPCATEEVAANVAAWMSSSVVRAVARELAERARGGWRRHFSWVIRMLPVPPAAARTHFRVPARFDLDGGALAALGSTEESRKEVA